MSLTVTPSSPFLATDGQNVGLFPPPSELTVAQAAKLLDMSEACLNELLDIDVLEFRQENGERFILWSRVLEFDQEQKRMETGLNEIVRMSQEMGLYDD